jgi:hypothetical protein
MELSQIEEIHRRHHRLGYGSLKVAEIGYLQELIVQHRPTTFLEVGTASGLTTGLVAALLDEHGGERIVTIDHDNTFFGDPTKENGFLIPSIYPSGRVEVVRRPFTTATSVPASGEQFEMAFIDANHQHPWPLMDTLSVLPAMRGSRILVHDDLNLYQNQAMARGIGPKHLFDQFPESHRDRAPVNDGNMFSVSLDLPLETVERIARDAFAIPWTLTVKMDDERLDAFRDVLRTHYSPDLVAHFERCAEKFNVPTGRMFKKGGAGKRPPA